MSIAGHISGGGWGGDMVGTQALGVLSGTDFGTDAFTCHGGRAGRRFDTRWWGSLVNHGTDAVVFSELNYVGQF